MGSLCAIPARAQADGTSVRIMTFNTLHGGTQRGQPLSQTAKVIQEAKAGIVGLQEIGKNADGLAELLGWNHVSDGWSAILTRHEIVGRYKGGIRVKLDSGREVCIFNVHLRPAPYQPYQLLGIPYGNAPFIKTEQEAIASAQEARGAQIAELLGQIRALPDQDAPVFVTGDFNEPSHLDWTEAAAESGRHPLKVAYPGSLAMEKAGFSDAWRVAYPDEMKLPGFTWTPLTKADDPKDHHDRIDFVYFGNKDIELNDVKIVGEDKGNADIVVSPYPSDHRAVVASFTLSKQSNPGKPAASKPDAGDGK
jgi:exodeoxyribonuclease-3